MVDKRVWKAAKTDVECRRTVKHWGYTKDPKPRRNQHKYDNNFDNVGYGMILLNKWTQSTLPSGISSPHQAAFVFEHIIDGLRSQFDQIEKARARNGVLENPQNNQLAMRQDLINMAEVFVTDSLREGAFDIFEVGLF
jgi:hypothetical protein